ncbi:hypothetical protein ACIQYZ_34900, partial [Rhodococcus erythropolis]
TPHSCTFSAKSGEHPVFTFSRALFWEKMGLCLNIADAPQPTIAGPILAESGLSPAKWGT